MSSKTSVLITPYPLTIYFDFAVLFFFCENIGLDIVNCFVEINLLMSNYWHPHYARFSFQFTDGLN